MNTEREGGTEMQQRERQMESKREREERKMQHRIEKTGDRMEEGDRCSTWVEKRGAVERSVFLSRLWQADKQSTLNDQTQT